MHLIAFWHAVNPWEIPTLSCGFLVPVIHLYPLFYIFALGVYNLPGSTSIFGDLRAAYVISCFHNCPQWGQIPMLRTHGVLNVKPLILYTQQAHLWIHGQFTIQILYFEVSSHSISFYTVILPCPLYDSWAFLTAWSKPILFTHRDLLIMDYMDGCLIKTYIPISP